MIRRLDMPLALGVDGQQLPRRGAAARRWSCRPPTSTSPTATCSCSTTSRHAAPSRPWPGRLMRAGAALAAHRHAARQAQPPRRPAQADFCGFRIRTCCGGIRPDFNEPPQPPRHRGAAARPRRGRAARTKARRAGASHPRGGPARPGPQNTAGHAPSDTAGQSAAFQHCARKLALRDYALRSPSSREGPAGPSRTSTSAPPQSHPWPAPTPTPQPARAADHGRHLQPRRSGGGAGSLPDPPATGRARCCACSRRRATCV
jgi:hypothetical protein